MFMCFGKAPKVELKDLRGLNEELSRKRPLVVFDEVEVTGRDPQILSKP